MSEEDINHVPNSTQWLSDVIRAFEVIRRGRFKAVTHNGVAHADDTIAAALLYDAGAEAIYRLSDVEEVLAVDGDVVLFDIGDSFADRLPQRFVVLDHHSSTAEPSSVVQVAMAVGASPNPQVQTLINFVDLFDRFGTSAKLSAGPFGNSLNKALSKYFGDATPRGLVREEEFLSLVADAFYSDEVVDFASLVVVYDVLLEKLELGDWVERFPRTFQFFHLMRKVPGNWDELLFDDALRTGFGIDFTTYALAVVPELEPYVLKGLEGMLEEAKKSAETAEKGRYTLIKGGAIAVAVEDNVSPSLLYNALLDLDALQEEDNSSDFDVHDLCEDEDWPCEGPYFYRREETPIFVVVRDLRTPGAYVLWRPDKFASRINFRRLEGDRVVFKHASGSLAVVKAESAEEAASTRYGLSGDR